MILSNTTTTDRESIREEEAMHPGDTWARSSFLFVRNGGVERGESTGAGTDDGSI